MVLTYSNMMPLGSPAPKFSLPGVDGKTWTLDDLRGGRALLVVFTCNHCPYALAVEERLIAIGRDFKAKGLEVALINSNDAGTHPDDSFEKMCERAQAEGFPFPYLHDESQGVARAYDAACTPDPYLFDGEGLLVYRGRIDDNWKEPEAAARHELREAIEAVLAGCEVDVKQNASLGCNIKWKPGNEPKI